MSEKDINVVFSNNLKYWLNQRGKTQADMYKRLAVSSATASDWCNAKKMPRADKLAELSRWLMIEISDLVQDKHREIDELDRILFRIKDDEEFGSMIVNLNSLDEESIKKVNDYIRLLMK